MAAAPNNYSVDIPPTVNLTDPAAAALAPSQPAIVAGSARALADVSNACAETKSRMKLRRNFDNVTEDEVSEAVVREFAVASEVAAGLYGPAGTPPWATAMVNQVTALANQVTALANLPNQVTALSNQVTALANQVAETNARGRSMEARSKNMARQSVGGNFELVQLCKVNADIGQPLPNANAAGRLPAVGLVNAAAIGTVYPTAAGGAVRFPRMWDDIDTLTHADISALAEWLNDDFGIVRNDAIGHRRRMVREHYTL